jgi:hypothetical protein
MTRRRFGKSVELLAVGLRNGLRRLASKRARRGARLANLRSVLRAISIPVRAPSLRLPSPSAVRALTSRISSPTVSLTQFSGETGTASYVQGGTEMGATRDRARRISRLIAALAVSDLAYRLFMREQIRRTLGIETRHA